MGGGGDYPQNTENDARRNGYECIIQIQICST